MLSIVAGIRGHGRVHVIWIKFRKKLDPGCTLYVDEMGFFTTLIAVCYIFSILEKHCAIT